MDRSGTDCDVKLVVKNTFLEYKHKARLGSLARSISTPPALEPSSRDRDSAKMYRPPSTSSISTELGTDSEGSSEAEQEWRTTVMLRNLPNNYTRAMLLKHIDEKGFVGLYDFFYLPIDFNTQACLGYAFINLRSPANACALLRAFDGFYDWLIPTRKRCMVGWSNPHQGLASNIERYRNSPVMHKDVPDAFKPCVFNHLSERTSFPSPTKRLRCPRFRAASQRSPNLSVFFEGSGPLASPKTEQSHGYRVPSTRAAEPSLLALQAISQQYVS